MNESKRQYLTFVSIIISLILICNWNIRNSYSCVKNVHLVSILCAHTTVEYHFNFHSIFWATILLFVLNSKETEFLQQMWKSINSLHPKYYYTNKTEKNHFNCICMRSIVNKYLMPHHLNTKNTYTHVSFEWWRKESLIKEEKISIDIWSSVSRFYLLVVVPSNWTFRWSITWALNDLVEKGECHSQFIKRMKKRKKKFLSFF